jgi:SDR family mycofactocin-dependent oxidoreductase
VTGRVQGKVAFITGAGRGQGRSHAVRLAREGADIIAIDSCEGYATVGYAMASEDDLQETCRLVEATGQRILARTVDVRDLDATTQTVRDGVRSFGRLDIVCANAGICTVQPWSEASTELWKDTLDVNVIGVWNSITASVPHLIDAGGGSIICTSSTAGRKGHPFLTPYVASKHAVVGMMKSMANELAVHNIRVNTIHPTGVRTPMVDSLGRLPELIEEVPSVGGIFVNSLPIGTLEPEAVSNAVLFLASDESAAVTGLEFTIDAGATNR